MTVFTFIARDSEGNPRKGTLEANSVGEISSQLRQRGWFIEEVEAFKEPALALSPKRWLRIRSVDIELALKQLALMVKSKVSLVPALQVVISQSSRSSMAKIWNQILREVQGGNSLASAMGKHSCFGPIIIQLVAIGEKTGRLDITLLRAAHLLEKKRNLRNNFIQASAYPAIVVVITLFAVSFMVLNVLPKIEQFLASLNKRLPPLTQKLLDISAWIQTYWTGVASVLLALFIFAIFFYFWPPSRKWLDRVCLRVPVYGKLLRLFHTSLFARLMSTMLANGLSVLESLRAISQVHSNRYLSHQIQIARECVLHGTSLSRPLAQPHAYLPMLSQMVAAGETSGNLSECLEEVANFYENQLDLMIRWIETISVPLVIILIGAIIGFIYIAFFISIIGGVSLNIR